MKQLLSLILAILFTLGLSGCSQDIPGALENEAYPPDATTDAAVPAEEVPTTEAPATEPPAAEPPTTAPTEPSQAYVEVFREGEASQIPVEIVEGSVGPYTIAMDPEYFTFQPQETAELFSYDAWDDGPGVFYAISDYRDDADPAAFLQDALKQFAPLFASSSSEETSIGGYPATAIYLNDFELDPEYQYHLFLVNCQGNYYTIECSFTFEMYEGLYAIMRACFDTMAPVG